LHNCWVQNLYVPGVHVPMYCFQLTTGLIDSIVVKIAVQFVHELFMIVCLHSFHKGGVFYGDVNHCAV
jgi:hypothetical protein